MAYSILTDPGDLVLLPAYGWRAIENAPLYMGRRIELIDVDETGNIDYNYTDITDTTFTFFPDSSTYAGQNNNYIWSLYTTEENLPEVLDGQGGVFYVILPQMDISLSDIPNNFRLYNLH